MKKIWILTLILTSFSFVSFGQASKADPPKLTQIEKQELKKDKEAFKATLTKEQVAILAAIKKAKKEANLKALPKKERKEAEMKFKAQKKAVYTPAQLEMKKAMKQKKKAFKNN